MPLDKLIARAGVASLREARQMIWAGRVAANGVVQTSCWVTAQADEVMVDGQPLPAPEPSRLFVFHKSPGVLDHKGTDHRPAIRLPAHLPRMAIVGGLGFDVEGALLLTNDGQLVKLIEKTQWPSSYRVLVHVRLSAAQAFLDESIRRGNAVPDPISGVWLAFIERPYPEPNLRWLRRFLHGNGCEVGRIIRISFGPVNLDDLAQGEVRELDAEGLRKQAVEYSAARAERIALLHGSLGTWDHRANAVPHMPSRNGAAT